MPTRNGTGAILQGRWSREPVLDVDEHTGKSEHSMTSDTILGTGMAELTEMIIFCHQKKS